MSLRAYYKQQKITWLELDKKLVFDHYKQVMRLCGASANAEKAFSEKLLPNLLKTMGLNEHDAAALSESWLLCKDEQNNWRNFGSPPIIPVEYEKYHRGLAPGDEAILERKKRQIITRAQSQLVLLDKP